MADNLTIPATGAGDATPVVATDKIGGVDYQRVKVTFGSDGTATDVDSTHQLPVTAVITGAPAISGTVTANLGTIAGVATEASVAATAAAAGTTGDASSASTLVGLLKAIKAAITGTIAVSGTFWQATQPVSGTVTANAGSGTLAVSGPLTDTQLRATPVPVSGGGTPLDLSSSGAFTALGQFVTLTPLDGMSTMQIDISGTFSGVSWAFEGTIDGTNWVPIPKGLVLTTNTGGQFIGTNLSAGSIVGNYTVPCAGLKGFRVECIAYSSGTMNIALRASAGTNAVSLTNSLPSGGNLIGDANTRFNGVVASTGHGISGTGVQRVELPTDGTGQVKLSAVATGGLTTFRLLSANSTNLTSVKGSAGRVCVISATNTNAAVRYLKLYDKASAPVLASDTPSHTLAISPSSTGIAFQISTDTGISFASGIALATTTGVADTDTGAVALNEVIVHLEYA